MKNEQDVEKDGHKKKGQDISATTKNENGSVDDHDEYTSLSPKAKNGLSVLERVADLSERLNINEYFESLRKPKRLLFYNFLYGVARGVGFAVGFTLLGAFIVYLLNQLEILNLPLIGDFITELLKYIDNNYGARV